MATKAKTAKAKKPMTVTILYKPGERELSDLLGLLAKTVGGDVMVTGGVNGEELTFSGKISLEGARKAVERRVKALQLSDSIETWAKEDALGSLVHDALDLVKIVREP